MSPRISCASASSTRISMTLPVLAPSSAARRSRSSSRIRVRHGTAGEEHPGKGDVLELAQVTEVVFNGQSLRTRPAKGLTQPPVRDPYPRLHRRDRTHVGGEIRHIRALCFIEQVERSVQVSLSLLYASHRHAPSSPVWREPGAFAQLLTCQQVLRRRLQIVTLTLQFTQSNVKVSRSTQHRLALGLPKRAVRRA